MHGTSLKTPTLARRRSCASSSRLVAVVADQRTTVSSSRSSRFAQAPERSSMTVSVCSI